MIYITKSKKMMLFVTHNSIMKSNVLMSHCTTNHNPFGIGQIMCWKRGFSVDVKLKGAYSWEFMASVSLFSLSTAVAVNASWHCTINCGAFDTDRTLSICQWLTRIVYCWRSWMFITVYHVCTNFMRNFAESDNFLWHCL